MAGLADQASSFQLNTGRAWDDPQWFNDIAVNGRCLPIVTVTGSRNFATTDIGKLLVVTGAATLTMPTNLVTYATSFVPTGYAPFITLMRRTASAVTVAATSGNVVSRGALMTLAGDRAMAELWLIASNDWTLSGDLA